jgi:hypothetical protein
MPNAPLQPYPIPTSAMRWKEHDPMHPNDSVFVEKGAGYKDGREPVVWVVRGKLSKDQIDHICQEGLVGFEKDRKTF